MKGATRGHRAVNEYQECKAPLLASQQGGVAERSRKYRGASADREAGVVFRSKHTRKTTPSAPAKEASRHLIYGAATPPCCDARRGVSTTAIHSQLLWPLAFLGIDSHRE